MQVNWGHLHKCLQCLAHSGSPVNVLFLNHAGLNCGEAPSFSRRARACETFTSPHPPRPALCWIDDPNSSPHTWLLFPTSSHILSFLSIHSSPHPFPLRPHLFLFPHFTFILYSLMVYFALFFFPSPPPIFQCLLSLIFTFPPPFCPYISYTYILFYKHAHSTPSLLLSASLVPSGIPVCSAWPVQVLPP